MAELRGDLPSKARGSTRLAGAWDRMVGEFTASDAQGVLYQKIIFLT